MRNPATVFHKMGIYWAAIATRGMAGNAHNPMQTLLSSYRSSGANVHTSQHPSPALAIIPGADGICTDGIYWLSLALSNIRFLYMRTILLSLCVAAAMSASAHTLSDRAHNPILPGFHADPELLYSENTGRYYIYSTTDGQPGWGGWYFHVFSSDNLTD